MNKIKLFGSAIAALSACLSCYAATTAHYLFIVSAATGQIITTTHSQQLILHNIDPQVLWFTDRPLRQSGLIPTPKFVHNWQQAFASDAPNAALGHADLTAQNNDQLQPAILELNQPQLKGKTLSFNIKYISSPSNSHNLSHVKLFLDDASFPINPQRMTPYPNFRFAIN